MSEPATTASPPTTVSVTSPISSRRVAMETQPQRIMLEVQARTVAKVLALVLAFSIVVSLLDTVRTVIVWFGIALFLAVVLNPLVAFTERWMRRNVAVVVVFIVFVVGLLAVLAMLVGPFVTQIDNIVSRRAACGRPAREEPADPPARPAVQHRRQGQGACVGAADGGVRRRRLGDLGGHRDGDGAVPERRSSCSSCRG